FWAHLDVTFAGVGAKKEERKMMNVLTRSGKGLLVAGGIALSMIAAPAASMLVAPMAVADTACYAGQSMDPFTGSCIPDVSPYSANTPLNAGCTGDHIGACVGAAQLKQNQAMIPNPVPRSSIDAN
ncbi:MAG TPA: hypothetical protein VFW21_15715, partial [Mycobacterium sp.]|nr:hypothetical protein [Mycobacterium sp.]